MKTMLEYIEAANDLLCTVWGEAKAAELRDYLKKYLSDWTPDEHDDLLSLCSSLAHWHGIGADEAVRGAQRQANEVLDASRKTSRAFSGFTTRARDKRETAHRQAVIERHFGAALRGDAGDEP